MRKKLKKISIDLENLNELIINKKFNISELLLFLEIIKMVKSGKIEDNILTFNYDTMLNLLKITKATYHNYLNKLEKAGLIIQFRGIKKQTRLYINFEV